MTTALLIFLGIIVLVGIFGRKKSDNAPAKRASLPRAPSAAPTTPRAAAVVTSEFTWPETDYCDVRIAGTSFYQDALKALVGDHGAHESQKTFKAALIPDDGNKHDNKAVRVEIDGRLVGHLSREDARSFRRRLGAKKMTGATTYCKAQITGGFLKRDGDRASYSVALSIKPFA